jgi:multiple antibiotic resistance protein
MPFEIGSLGKQLFLVVFTLLPIINPLGLTPIYLGMTAGWPEDARTGVARRIGIYTFFLLVSATFLGSLILAFFGLSLDAVRIGGGLLVSASGWRLLNSEPEPHTETPVEPSDELISSRAFYPLTFPLTCGPGSISVALTLGAGLFSERVQIDERSFATLLGLSVVSALVYLCYRSAPRLGGLIGRTGSIVMLRLSAFILLCLGVQIILDAGFKILRAH